VVEKLIRRHPHVFGDVSVYDADDVAKNWEAIKQEERKQNGETEKKKTMLDGISATLPALSRAQTYVSRLSRVGYPLPEPELLTEEELGRRLLTLAELAEATGLDAEAALRASIGRLREALLALEAQTAARDQDFLELDDLEKEALWRQWLDARD
jgi:uncharacterized protein YabN with tetrapyrrole methylase and pyrophosphatase domain